MNLFILITFFLEKKEIEKCKSIKCKMSMGVADLAFFHLCTDVLRPPLKYIYKEIFIVLFFAGCI